MESVAAYLNRKHQELTLLNGCLRTPLPLRPPGSIADVIRDKFQLTAMLKAEHALHDWAVTETAWAHASQRCHGPFTFHYDYQRADLDVRGPSFYALDAAATAETIYTASGMAAISALLSASARVIGRADIVVLSGSYGETFELIEAYAGHLRLVTVAQAEQAVAAGRAPAIMLLDSCAPAGSFEAVLRLENPAFDLVIFDSTCFANGSGRIRRVLNWARNSDIPVVMVRSHTKLDSLGAEYGRLGSAAFIRGDNGASWTRRLSAEMRNAVRLFGGAALPAHFPPYIGTPAYRDLTERRMAAILRNTRRAVRYFASAIPGLTAELRFAHGLYVTLASPRPLDEAAARQAAAAMSEDLASQGLPIRHAGSFGFDFAATEWFHSPATGQYNVRVAVPDLPTALWDDITHAVARWWLRHHGELRCREAGSSGASASSLAWTE
jgi:hypothetical protein